jgi:hypothetical protein
MTGASGQTEKIRVAFVRIGGLSAGGTERWLQMMAASLPRERFDVTYFYSANPPHLGSVKPAIPPDPHRKKFMEDAGIKLIEVKMSAKDANTPTNPWVNTDFWSLFDERQFDIVQTAKSGPAEYPFHMMRLPVVEYVVLSAGVDFSPNIACSIHLSEWQRRRWIEEGGKISNSTVIPIPANMPATDRNMRAELDIPSSALVAGFHQQASDVTYSSIPLASFSLIERYGYYFLIFGGSNKYRQQARALGLKNVRFLPHTGNAESISAFLNTLDVFAHGRADGETFGAVFAEAMMHGKPCMSHLTTIANGQIETIGPAGFVVDGVGAYAQGILRLFNDPELRMRLGEAGRRHAVEYYSLELASARLGEVYERVARSSQSLAVDRPRISPMSYGVSDLGCLYPGALNDSTSVSRHVLMGGVPDAFNLHVFDYFAPEIRTMIDLTENAAIYGPRLLASGASDARVLVADHSNEFLRTLPKLIELNNWQDRIGVLRATSDSGFEIRCPEMFASAHANAPALSSGDPWLSVDCLRLRADPNKPNVLKCVDDWILRSRPLICVEGTNDRANQCVVRRLYELDYLVLEKVPRCFRLRTASARRAVSQSTTLWCLPRERYDNELPAIFGWAQRFQYRSPLKRRLKVINSRVKHAVRVSPILRTGVSVFRRSRSFLVALQTDHRS